MEAPRGAREPTGTNWPTLNNTQHNREGETKTANNSAATTIQTTINPHPPTQKRGGARVEHQSCGGHSTGETPSNISNLEAKPGSANGTATDRLWESRTPPQHTPRRRASSTWMRPFAHYPMILRRVGHAGYRTRRVAGRRWLLLVDPRVFWAPGPPASRPRRDLRSVRRLKARPGPAAHGDRGPRAPQLGLPISPAPFRPGSPISHAIPPRLFQALNSQR